MRLSCQYVIVKFLKNVARDEPINIGVIIQTKEGSDCRARFLSNLESRLRGIMNPSLASLVIAYTQELSRMYSGVSEARDITGSPAELSLRYLHERQNGNVQFTEPRSTAAIDLDEEVDHLFAEFVAPEMEVGKRALKSRLRSLVRKDLREHALLRTRKQAGFKYRVILADGFSKAPLTFDFAYRNGSLYVLETVEGQRKRQLSGKCTRRHSNSTTSVRTWEKGPDLLCFPFRSRVSFGGGQAELWKDNH